MRKKELLSRIDFLRKKAELSKLVIFVGAGVSCNVEGFYNWNDLIVEMAREIGYEKCSFCRHG